MLHVEIEELLLFQKGDFLVLYSISYRVLVAIQKRQQEEKLNKIEAFGGVETLHIVNYRVDQGKTICYSQF